MGAAQPQDLMDNATARLKQARKRLWEAERKAQLYQPGDPDPYRSDVAQLYQTVADARNQYQEIAGQRAQPRQQVPHSPQGRLRILRDRLVKPYSQRNAGKQARSLLELAERFEAQVDRAGQILEDLRRKPLAVAARCADLSHLGDRIDPVAGDLRRAGLHGADLDLAVDEARQLDKSLRQLPACFFLDAESLILDQASKQNTIDGWQTLEQIEAPLRQHVASLEEWQKQFQDIGSMLAALPAAIALTTARLTQMRASMDVHGMVAELAQAENEVQSLRTASSNPVVGQLHPLADAIAATTRKVNDLGEQAGEIRQQLEDLRATLHVTSTLCYDISMRMNDAAKASVHPIAWGQYRDDLDRLEEIQADLKAVVRRTPQRLSKDVQSAGTLRTDLQALSRRVEQACQHRDTLLSLLEQPELSDTSVWLQQAQTLHAQAVTYAAENWPSRLAVSRLRYDAEGLYWRLQQLVPADVSQPLVAADLQALVQQVQALVRAVQRLESRLEQVANRLLELQKAEQSALQKLEPAYRALEQLVVSLKNASPPVDAKITRHRPKLESLEAQGGRLLADFRQRGSGLLDHKVTRLREWLRDCEEPLRYLLPVLIKDKERAGAELQSQVESWQALASFDLENAMGEATKLLKQQKPVRRFSPDWNPHGQRWDVASFSGEAHSLLVERKSLMSALANLQSDIVKPLHSPRERWENTRKEALQGHEQILTLKRSVESTWPQLICDIKQVEDFLQRANADEKKLHRQGRSEVAVRELLGQITENYESAIAAMKRQKGQISQEQHELKDLLTQIEQRRSKLTAYGQRYSDDQAVVQAVNERVHRVEAELDGLERQWRKEPPSFREARRAFENLWSLASADLHPRGSNRTIRSGNIESGSR